MTRDEEGYEGMRRHAEARGGGEEGRGIRGNERGRGEKRKDEERQGGKREIRKKLKKDNEGGKRDTTS